ncbi:MAG: M12 family metallopeptidase [Nocardioidaceae bacterium]
MNLAPGGTTGNAIHEIGHTVGMWHEQSRQDRDAFVTIHWANIQTGLEHNFNQHVSDGDNVGNYDYGSIMRPQLPMLDAVTDDAARGFVHGEWHEALYGLYRLLDCPLMNPPDRNDAASRKPLQLQVASRLGLRVPDPLMPRTGRRRRSSWSGSGWATWSTRSSARRTRCGGRPRG